MERSLEIKIVPIGQEASEDVEYELDGSGLRCSADHYRDVIDWHKSALEIRWNSTARFFSVEFKGSGRIPVGLSNLLSKRIPLKIAQTSRCECGSVLELGDYSVAFEDSDFRFKADYFCPTCKARAIAEQKGLKKVLETWFSGLKKIEIKATGVGFERN